MAIHQELSIKGSLENSYKALVTAERFGEFTNAPVDIAPAGGGSISCFDGQIIGRNIELH